MKVFWEYCTTFGGKGEGRKNDFFVGILGRGVEKTGQRLAGTGSSFRGKCFQGKKTAVMVRHSCAAVSSHVAATATDSYNCRLFAQEVLIPSKRRQSLPTPGLFLATLSRSVRAREFSFFDRLFYFFRSWGSCILRNIADLVRDSIVRDSIVRDSNILFGASTQNVFSSGKAPKSRPSRPVTSSREACRQRRRGQARFGDICRVLLCLR